MLNNKARYEVEIGYKNAKNSSFFLKLVKSTIPIVKVIVPVIKNVFPIVGNILLLPAGAGFKAIVSGLEYYEDRKHKNRINSVKELLDASQVALEKLKNNVKDKEKIDEQCKEEFLRNVKTKKAEVERLKSLMD